MEGGAEFVTRHAGNIERSDNTSSFCSSSRIYDVFVADKPMYDMIKRASKYRTSVPRHALTVCHTKTRTTPATRPLKAAAIQCGEAGDDFSIHTVYLLIFFSSCLYIFSYMRTFSLKMTVSTCVKNN